MCLRKDIQDFCHPKTKLLLCICEAYLSAFPVSTPPSHWENGFQCNNFGDWLVLIILIVLWDDQCLCDTFFNILKFCGLWRHGSKNKKKKLQTWHLFYLSDFMWACPIICSQLCNFKSSVAWPMFSMFIRFSEHHSHDR